MTVGELEKHLSEVADKDRPVMVSVGNPLFCEDFEVADIFRESSISNAIFLMVFAEGKYDF